MLAIFISWILKRLYQSSGKEKESCCLLFTSSLKREIRHFHVVVVQRRQRNVQKSVIHMKLLFCQSTPTAFFPSSLLKLPSKAPPSFPIHHLNLLIPPLQFTVSHPSLVSFTLCLNTGWDQFFFPLLSFYFPLFETSNQPLPFTKKKIK